jgi:glutathione synthase
MLALTLKKDGESVFLLFEKDFYINNKKDSVFLIYDFEGEFDETGIYLKSFELKNEQLIPLSGGDILHMRIDPPFDTRYLRYLWMLKFLEVQKIIVINSPNGILVHNEKLHAYSQKSSLPTYVGSSLAGLHHFFDEHKNVTEYILKPLDLFQGFGVEKVDINKIDVDKKFLEKVRENNGAVVVQPFFKAVEKGEIRSLYFNGRELGSILKIPKSGDYLANIAQGASFHAITLSPNVKIECDRICKELVEVGVPWVAFDIMGDVVSEVNITCPGLLVEVSFAHKKNLALEIMTLLRKVH